jgi:Ca-activated chloride channel homolog
MSARRRLLMELALTALGTAVIVLLMWPLAQQEVLALGEEHSLLAPRMLLLVAVTPALLWSASRSLADLPRAQRWLGIASRVLLVSVLAVALARPVQTARSEKVSTVFLVDVSDSMPDAAIEEARSVIAAAAEARGEHDMHVVTFAQDAKVVPWPEGSDAPPIERHAETPRAGAATDLQAALQLAYGLFAPDHLRRVVLLSDGGQTQGDLLGEAERAARFGVRMHYVALAHGAPAEVAVREVALPERIQVGEPFHVRARLFASRPVTARVRLYQGDTLNGLDGVRDVTLETGDTEIQFRSIVRVAGPVTYRCELVPEGPDRFDDNNRFEVTAVVPGRPAVLYVEGTEGRAEHLARALTAAEFEVEVRGPRGIPTDLRELERFEFFILSDVPADRVSLTQMDVIERYVREQGGGFLMSGGESSFGLGGWQGTRMERILPVRMDAERRRDQPSLALSLIIDKSGSMNGLKMELAKEAARATAEMLGPDDYIAVVGFDSQPSRVVRMQSARNRMAILRDIGRLEARGGTDIFPALDMAYQDLSVTRARIKHTILLTDGISPDRGIEELVQLMRAEGITVTTVGLGADVNRTLLAKVASMGGGRSYFTNDPHHVPRIFMKETTTVARSAAVDDYFRPTVLERADFLRGMDLRAAPYLRGYVATRPKPPPAQVILQSDTGDPTLARWRVGLGWTLAWTSDVKARWSADWIRWPGFSRFWAQLVREHMRQRHSESLEMQARMEGSDVHVVVDAIGSDDRFMNGLDSRVTLEGPMGSARRGEAGAERLRETHSLRQTAPGRYEARFPLHRHGAFVLTAVHERDGRAVAESATRLAHPYPREYLTFEADETLLAGAARTTGGGRLDEPTNAFASGGEWVESRRDLWPMLLFLALVLFILDLLLRRVRLFDRSFRATSRARGPLHQVQ